MASDLINNLSEATIKWRLEQALFSPDQDFESSERIPPGLISSSPRSAAVLIALLRNRNSWHVLFTRRTDSLPEHSGQVAFPGGRADPEDQSPIETALRESSEELGINPGDVLVLGQLRQLHTISDYCVTPVVGRINWPYDFHPAEKEVSRVFTIPLAWLATPGNHEIRMRQLPQPYDPVPVIYFKHYSGELLWGVSARITLNLLHALRLI